MDWQEPHERNDTATAADLGLTPLADPATAPEWLLAEPEPMPRYLCCEYAMDWHISAGPDAAHIEERARRLAQVYVLQAEVDRRNAHDLAKSAVAQAAETEVRIKDREREIEIVRNQYNVELTSKQELREGNTLVHNKLRDYGFDRGNTLERLEAMHAARNEALSSLSEVAHLLNEAELLLAQHNVPFDAFQHYGALEKANRLLRQQVAQSGAHFRPSPPDAAA